MVRFSLRVPAVTYQAIVNQAHAEHRSVNQQIVSILEAATKGAWIGEDHGIPGQEPLDIAWEDKDQ